MKKLFCLFSMQILLFLLLLLSGCSKDYLDTLLTCGTGYVLTDKNIPDWDGLGVYCVLTNSDVQTLLVKDANGVVGGAKAELYASGKLVGEFVYNAADCAYNLDYTPVAGGSYMLKVSYNGAEVEAATVMPAAVERVFVCNPAIVPMVFKESVYHDYEEEYLREGLYSLFEKYPSYTYNAQGADVVTYSYFVDKDGIVDKLYSTSMDRGLYNRSDESFVARYVMPGEPDKFADRVYREFLEGSVWKERKYDFSMKVVRIPVKSKSTHPYTIASYVCSMTSSPVLVMEELDYVINMIKENPQYGCYEDRCEFYGPDFLVLPYYKGGVKSVEGRSCTQVLLSVSDDYDMYLMNCMDYEFDDIAQIKSNFTNIAGGFGVFGAQCKVEYDFSVYRQELKELYFDVIDKLEVKPPVKYGNPGLDYRW